MTGDFFLRNFIGRQNVTPAFTYTYAKQLLNKDKVLSETKTELILSIEYCAVLVNTYLRCFSCWKFLAEIIYLIKNANIKARTK